MVFAFAGNALAAYDQEGNLAMTVYNEVDQIERNYDLGTIGVDFQLTDENVTLQTGVDYANMLELGYWASKPGVSPDEQYGFDGMFATTSANAPGVNSTAASSFNSAGGTIADYGTVTDPATYGEGIVHATSLPGAFVENYGAGGNYNGLNLNSADGVASLGTIGVTDYVDMYLWYAGYDASFSYGIIEGDATPYQAILRLESDGDVILNPVPVPAAAWLLASGLLGLVGLRRKNA